MFTFPRRHDMFPRRHDMILQINCCCLYVIAKSLCAGRRQAPLYIHTTGKTVTDRYPEPFYPYAQIRQHKTILSLFPKKKKKEKKERKERERERKKKLSAHSVTKFNCQTEVRHYPMHGDGR